VTSPVRRPLLVGNWKMNLGEPDATALIGSLLTLLPFDRVDVAVAPSFPCLRAVLDAAAGTPLAVSAQNVHWEAAGAFTGEVSPSVLAGMGVRFVIVGHSERRALFGETDADVARKIAAARRHGLTPIVCVGEDRGQRDAGETAEIVAAQIRAGLSDPTVASPDGIVVAYEPVWAIGSGKTPVPAEITGAHDAIRATLSERFGASSASVRVLYGGSVTAGNAASLLRAPSVDGALVGGASLDPSAFAAIAAAAGAC
jgi:triosephosphate isomerase (TIM)